jgi:hypothetical protein
MNRIERAAMYLNYGKYQLELIIQSKDYDTYSLAQIEAIATQLESFTKELEEINK